jgi:hypothetical protein
VAKNPNAGGIFVADHRTTHCPVRFVLLIAGRCALPIESLGKKGRSGVMRSVRTRKEFSMDPSHRARFGYTPKHPSGLNPVEIGSSLVARRGFRSKGDPRDRLLRFIEYFNRAMAKTYQWTDAGRPVHG